MNKMGAFQGGLIAGVPICRGPEHVRQYPNFLTWWNEVGRLNPKDHKGWSSISGPGVMQGRSEIIDSHAWEALQPNEREMIREWAESIPLSVFYD